MEHSLFSCFWKVWTLSQSVFLMTLFQSRMQRHTCQSQNPNNMWNFQYFWLIPSTPLNYLINICHGDGIGLPKLLRQGLVHGEHGDQIEESLKDLPLLANNTLPRCSLNLKTVIIMWFKLVMAVDQFWYILAHSMCMFGTYQFQK